MFSSLVLAVFASIFIMQEVGAFQISDTRTSLKISRIPSVKMADNAGEKSDENSLMDILSGM